MSSTSREPDRLILFTDAVVAIAITLLILPLVDLANEPVEHASEIVTGHLDQIGGFLLSFVVIARLWLAHHRMFQHVRFSTSALVLWNMLWVFTVVVLPFPTELAGRFGRDTFTVAFYIGTILASSISQTALIMIIHRHPEIQDPDNRLSVRDVAGSVTATGLIALALILAMLVPPLSYFPMLLLLLSHPVLLLWERTRSNRATATT
ncbi:MAG: TMEM175 family protein [Kibdelosporangium sp.]